MIASLFLLGALLIVGDPRRLQLRFHAVAAVAILGGPAYTAFSEWLNTVIRGSWAYAGAKPRLPFVGAGSSPSAPCIVIPFTRFCLGGNPRHSEHTQVTHSGKSSKK